MVLRQRIQAVFLTTSFVIVGCTDRVFVGDGIATDSFTPGDGSTSMDVSSGDSEVPPPDSDGPPPPPPPPDTDGMPPAVCGDVIVVPDVLPVVLGGDFLQGPSRFEPSCVGVESAEITFAFTAPYTDTFVFDTVGSSFDTILYAYGPTCEPPELACNDDVGGTLASSISLSMQAGETVVVVLDSFGESGTYALQIRDGGVCPELELEPMPAVQVESVLDDTAADSITPSCGGVGPDITYLWIPPWTGRFRFTTAGSEFDTVLSLHSADCTTELACNDDAQGDASSLIDLDVVEGVPVVVGVSAFDGTGGLYRLSIFEV